MEGGNNISDSLSSRNNWGILQPLAMTRKASEKEAVCDGSSAFQLARIYVLMD